MGTPVGAPLPKNAMISGQYCIEGIGHNGSVRSAVAAIDQDVEPLIIGSIVPTAAMIKHEPQACATGR